jgi:glycerophosphoryl diester phosphodiesterase
VEVIAHRGLVGPCRPENTVAAVRAALAAGADGVEVDARLTADGLAVCCHDGDLSRVAGHPLQVAASTYDAVAAVALPGGHTVPPLAEVIARVTGRARLIVEIKPPGAPVVAAEIARLLRLAGPAAHGVVVSSFDPAALEVIRRDAVAVRRALLTEAAVPARSCVHRAAQRGHQEAHPHVTALTADPAAIKLAHDRGLAVRGWTVNSSRAAAALYAAGADGIIADLPVLQHDLMQAQAADLLARPVGRVKSQTATALAKLRGYAALRGPWDDEVSPGSH